MASNQRNFIINFSTGSNLAIQWGDGTTQNVTSGTSVTKTYPATNTEYLVRLTGSIGAAGRIYFTGNARIIGTTAIESVSGITNLTNLLSGQNLLDKVPRKFLASVPDATNLSYLLYECPALQALPPDLLNYTPDVTTLERAFVRNYEVESIPSGFFDGTPNINNFNYAFYDCTNLTGTAPPIWTMYPGATGTQCFRNCTKLSNYAAIPSGWK